MQNCLLLENKLVDLLSPTQTKENAIDIIKHFQVLKVYEVKGENHDSTRF
jgi:hypothetical protein